VYFIGFPSSLLALGVRSCDTNKIWGINHSVGAVPSSCRPFLGE
jgi:hypothetical protein